jgi:hypothetical protein
MLSTTLNKQKVTVNSSLSGLYDAISGLNSLLFANSCPTNFDITNQIPLWMVYEKQDRLNSGMDGLSIYDFIQKYYDWLYCDDTSGAQYELSKRLLDVVDVDKTRSKFLERLANIYANGFDASSLVENGGLVSDQNLRNFIKGIRRTFYHKKTTEDGIKYFFHTLYGVDEEDVQITTPKKLILRLNGGRFSNDDFYFAGQTGTYDITHNLAGSHLNGSRLQDGNWIQDWSYLLKVGVPAYQYKNSYLNMAHPAGMKVVFEKTLADYLGPTYDDTIPTVCDSAYLRNYAAYGISFNYSSSTSGITYSNPTYWNSIKGLQLCGFPRNTGCCGISFSGFTGQTNLFPNWSSESNYNITNFRNININTMFELCYSSDVGGSPNSGFSSTCP